MTRPARRAQLGTALIGTWRRRGVAAAAPEEGPAGEGAGRFLVLESCHSTWLFDQVDLRFCRIVKGLGPAAPVATEWRSYDRLLLNPDSEPFVVFLNAVGSRLLRSWRHTADCDLCGGKVTAEVSLGELRRIAGS